MVKRSPTEKGYVGETYTMAKLSRDFNIVSVKVPQEYFHYDLITSNNKRLEVKTASLTRSTKTYKGKPSYSYGWQWRRTPPQRDEFSSNLFIVCIGFPSDKQQADFSGEPRCFIIPSEKLRGRSENFKITANPSVRRRTGKTELALAFENKWELIAQ